MDMEQSTIIPLVMADEQMKAAQREAMDFCRRMDEEFGVVADVHITRTNGEMTVGASARLPKNIGGPASDEASRFALRQSIMLLMGSGHHPAIECATELCTVMANFAEADKVQAEGFDKYNQFADEEKGTKENGN